MMQKTTEAMQITQTGGDASGDDANAGTDAESGTDAEGGSEEGDAAGGGKLTVWAWDQTFNIKAMELAAEQYKKRSS